MKSILFLSSRLAAAALMAVLAVSAISCSSKEKVLDVETPRGELEIQRDRDTGDVEVEVNKDDK